MKNKGLICIGHRGAGGHEPENTLASVRKALQLGAVHIELDVHHVDGHLLVFHDDRLERTTNGTGYLLKHNFSYLRSLDAGNGEKIPTLEEVFELIDRRAAVNIELKGPNTAQPIVNLISSLHQQGWSKDQILVSSFNHDQLTKVKSLDPQIKLGLLIDGPPTDAIAIAAKLGAYSIHPELPFIDQQFVDDAHSRGMRVFVFTVNNPDDIQKMQHLNVDGIFTDYPERVVNKYQKEKQEIAWL